MTKYIPPVVRLEEDEDLEDIMPLPEEPEELSESEDVFADFFSSQGKYCVSFFCLFVCIPIVVIGL